MIAKELVEEKRHLHHRIGEGLTRPQVFRRAASLCHNAIESPPADGQGEQRRSEQPAPLSLTRTMVSGWLETCSVPSTPPRQFTIGITSLSFLWRHKDATTHQTPRLKLVMGHTHLHRRLTVTLVQTQAAPNLSLDLGRNRRMRIGPHLLNILL